jgi:hypothetical protein
MRGAIAKGITDQLAAYLKQSMTSGAFRLRVSAAATFCLTENERGKVKLTTLGRRIADPAQEASARADAFLTVPLYLSVYENFKGYTLPGAARRLRSICGMLACHRSS